MVACVIYSRKYLVSVAFYCLFRLSDDCLNDGSRVRRPFASLSALLYMCERSLCLVLRWTASTLDESILTDRRRRHVFQSFYNRNYFIRMFNKINTFFLLGVILFVTRALSAN